MDHLQKGVECVSSIVFFFFVVVHFVIVNFINSPNDEQSCMLSHWFLLLFSTFAA